MRIGFVILSHRHPAQLLRLVTTLKQQLPDAPIVIHHDRFRTNLPSSKLDCFEDVHLLTSDEPTAWGDFSVVDATWRAMAWMLGNVQFDWVVMLSAQDYPIRTLNTLSEYFAGTGADAVLHAVPISEFPKKADRRERRRRYLYQYKPAVLNLEEARLSDRLRSSVRKAAGRSVDVINVLQPCIQIYRLPSEMPYRVGMRARVTPFAEEMPCWQGSMWFGLSRRATEFLVSSVRDRPDYVEYYRKTIIPDESATATLICNAPELRVVRERLHYARWSHPKSGHPDVFTSADLPELVASQKYFARKFDITRDVQVLDQLDEILSGAESIPNDRMLSLGPREKLGVRAKYPVFPTFTLALPESAALRWSPPY